MADGYFQYCRYHTDKCIQIGLVQIVPGIDADAQRLCFGRGPCTGCGSRRVAMCESLGIWTGIELDAVDAEVMALIDRSVAAARSAAPPTAADLLTDVYVSY